MSWRFGLAFVGVSLVVFLAWRVSLSFSQGETIKAQSEQIATLGAAMERDARAARELATYRGELAEFAQGFRDELASKPITREVVKYVDKTTGETVTCRERDPVRYRELFNEAVAGPAGLH